MAARFALVASIFVAASLAAGTASAQPAPATNGDGRLDGGGPFGNRGGSSHGGPFTPGVDGPAGPYTPGTTSGNGGSGPFTPGVDGPRGPYTPGTLDTPNNGGPFTRKDEGGGFWNKVKSVGRSVWDGFTNVVYWVYTLGGYASWAKSTVGAVVPQNGMGVNVARNANTNPPPPIAEDPRRPLATQPELRKPHRLEGAGFVRP